MQSLLQARHRQTAISNRFSHNLYFLLENFNCIASVILIHVVISNLVGIPLYSVIVLYKVI